ncbi:hypothetical protein SCHPADRAFT_233428 [Schizopora paradoxa]|uniref:Uncharacterized protein n=1 Tax=Schizopora paradoxa TaxID=27342 RepID=A0A0H2RWR2_9AGAM|nr:hypothetical protein SCHPADRAFT_233428 [Schizopora paradoxa]
MQTIHGYDFSALQLEIRPQIHESLGLECIKSRKDGSPLIWVSHAIPVPQNRKNSCSSVDRYSTPVILSLKSQTPLAYSLALNSGLGDARDSKETSGWKSSRRLSQSCFQ